MGHVNLYEKELQTAIQKTVTEKYIIPLEAIKDLLKYKPYLNQETYALLKSLFLMRFGEQDGLVDLSKIKGHCISIHLQMAEVIEKELNTKPVITIGYVNCFGIDMFKFNDIGKDALRHNPDKDQTKIGIHTWLTLPSLEIVDFTFLADLHYTNADENKKQLLRKATSFDYNFGNADHLKENEGIIYHPVYVGKNVLMKNVVKKDSLNKI